MNNIETMKLARRALWFAHDDGYSNELSQEALNALRQAIKQAQQAEPVVGVFDYKEHAEGLQRDYDLLLAEYNDLKAQQAEPVACGYDETTGNCTNNPCCYTSPPPRQWVGLTDWEINSIAQNNHPLDGIRTFARAIEAKLKEKNT